MGRVYASRPGRLRRNMRAMAPAESPSWITRVASWNMSWIRKRKEYTTSPTTKGPAISFRTYRSISLNRTAPPRPCYTQTGAGRSAPIPGSVARLVPG